ncbi:hypothetical protein [Arboricoccus pini]|nr:hypothetical protein [Arboricoccus pini]
MAGSRVTEAAQPVWPDTRTARLEALVLLETLNADLLSHDSATLTLDRWCKAHGLGQPAVIVADRVRDEDKPADDAVRARLGVGPTETVGYRRVRLRCGQRVLSLADNWYVPARLSPEMNEVLATTDTAFGRAVQGLHFQRHTLSADLLWQPLPAGWEMAPLPASVPPASTTLAIPDMLIRHQAVLTLPDGTPFSLVVETYTRDVLAFPPPPAP